MDKTSSNNSMNWDIAKNRYEKLLSSLSGGKRISDNVYFHISYFKDEPDVGRFFCNLEELTDDKLVFNVVRFSKSKCELAFLNYLNFFDDPFPVLTDSTLINLDNQSFSKSNFSTQENPPILHRKELLLSDDDERREKFEKLTLALEDYGAFDRPANIIGRKLIWNDILSDLRIKIENDRVITTPMDSAINILRHRTAISRSRLSTPVQALVRWGLLENSDFFDYGCGRGDDIKALSQSGIEAIGWDPYFAATAPIKESQVVNLGFVLNVIENSDERRGALERAFSLTTKVMAVAVMLVGRGSGEKILDGVVTSRNTFQKYYTQSEAYEYIKRILKRDPISVGSGIFFIFKNDVDEQGFLSRRQISKMLPSDYLDGLFPYISKNKSEKISRLSVRLSLYEKHTDYFDNFWQTCITLGRFPAIDEYEYDSSILTNPKKIYSTLPYKDKEQQLEIAKNQRRGDLLVYLSMNLFEKRKSISAQPLNVQRDIKAFFGANSAALSEAAKFLFSLSSVDNLALAVSNSAAKKLGLLAKDGDYTFHISKLTEQDPIVRILIGCSEKLEAFPGDADLIKIHTISRRISFLTFDDFLEKPIPALIRRLRIDLSRQRVNTEIYSSPGEQRLLYGKSYFIDENYRRFGTQKRFDDKLQDIGIFRAPGLGGTVFNLNSRLLEANAKLLGFRIFSVN